VRFVRASATPTELRRCGTTQHYLLLDEFYRTAIWLAGRTPIWWLVPVYEETRYAEFTHTLMSKRFIRADEPSTSGTWRTSAGRIHRAGCGCSRASSRPTSRCSSCC
jgi:adenylate cyclase